MAITLYIILLTLTIGRSFFGESTFHLVSSPYVEFIGLNTKRKHDKYARALTKLFVRRDTKNKHDKYARAMTLLLLKDFKKITNIATHRCALLHLFCTKKT